MPRVVEEFIYPAMEDFRIDIVLGEGINARTISMQLKRFTLIGATTRSGMLSSPMRDRFKMHEHLEFYTRRGAGRDRPINAAKLQTPITPGRRPGDRPPQPGHAARRQRPAVVDAQLRHQRGRRQRSRWTSPAPPWTWPRSIAEGLDKQDRRYLETLIGVFEGGPTGVEALAATMNLPADTLSDEIEPYLLREQFIVRTSRGRQATAKAYQHLGKPPPSAGETSQGSLFG